MRVRTLAPLATVVALLGAGCLDAGPLSEASEAAIWNGSPTSDFEAVGALAVDGEAVCTGTLIDETTVLTAAHCVDYLADFTTESLTFYSGQGIAGGVLTGGVAIGEGLIHPAYDGVNADVGLLFLDDSAPWTPAPLNRDVMVAADWEGVDVTLVGYGISEDGQDDAGLKQYTEVAIYAFDEDVFFHYTDNTNACFGDSGGPALAQVDGAWTVVGVLSGLFPYIWDQLVCVGGGGYQMRVDLYADWIDENSDPSAGDDDDSAADDDDSADDDTDGPGGTGGGGVGDETDDYLDDGGDCRCSVHGSRPLTGGAVALALAAALLLRRRMA